MIQQHVSIINIERLLFIFSDLNIFIQGCSDYDTTFILKYSLQMNQNLSTCTLRRVN